MRIALVCPYAWDRPGGVQSHIRSLSHALQERGHQTTVIAPARKAVDGEEGIVRAGRPVGIPANGSVAPIAFGPIAAAAARKAIRSFGPDVLHVHEPLIPSLSLLALTGGARLPTVGTFHAAAAKSNGYRIGRPFLARVARRLTLRTAVSEAAKSFVSRYFPGDYSITPNGVDVERFATAEPLEWPAEKNVLFFSRIEPRKGLDVLIEAMSLLDDPEVTLIVAGDGPQAERVRAKAESLGIRARFLGRLSEDDVPRAYRAASVFVAPGLGGESFGIVLVEAMAAGCPVVCSDLPGFKAVVGDAALRFTPGDPRALASAIHMVLGERRVELARKAAERGSAFDWAKLVAGVEDLYERALK